MSMFRVALLLSLGGTTCSILPVTHAIAETAVQIGSRRELFVDDYLVARVTGSTRLLPKKPVPREVVLVTDKPWEGSSCLYFMIFRDQSRYRMYYRGLQTGEAPPAHHEVVCYAESLDGITWKRPELNLVAFRGSTRNNIIWDGLGSHNFTPFIDRNPNCSPQDRYKAVGRGQRTPDGGTGTVHQLFAFQSPDGIHWTRMQLQPILVNGGFDSQNLAFWDTTRHTYLAFYRKGDRGVRAIATSSSTDFKTWTRSRFLDYRGAPRQDLYTNAIQPYDRAPHLLIGFPTRFYPQRQFPDQPEWTEPILVASHDGRSFRAWNQSVIPVNQGAGRTGNRSNYLSAGLVPMVNNPAEYSVYASEDRRTGTSMRLRRFAYRTDGFVTVNTSTKPGHLYTKPLVFEGDQLSLNFQTGIQGQLQLELLNLEGKPLPGFSLADCTPIMGNHLEKHVQWKHGTSVTRLMGRPVRLHFVMRQCDLYSFQFQPRKARP